MKSGVTKLQLVKSLESTLKLTREPIESLELADNDTVIICYKGGAMQVVDIACDSGLAIIRDVSRAITY